MKSSVDRLLLLHHYLLSTLHKDFRFLNGATTLARKRLEVSSKRAACPGISRGTFVISFSTLSPVVLHTAGLLYFVATPQQYVPFSYLENL